ncbi:MAG TPA: hypothetical protein VGK67_35330 [Myxococcales bacterium]|jgi:hypothetical protein
MRITKATQHTKPVKPSKSPVKNAEKTPAAVPLTDGEKRQRQIQRDAADRWNLFADLLERAAGLARMTERSVTDGGSLDPEAAGAAIVLALDAVEPDRVAELRKARDSDAYAIYPEEAAWQISDRLLGASARAGKVA